MNRFPKTLSVEQLKKFDVLLAQSQDNELVLPVDTTKYTFGGMASAIQSVITWANNSEENVLRITPSSSKDIISEILRRPHKFAAAMMAKSLFLNNEDVKQKIYLQAKEKIEEQERNTFGLRHGSLCWFTFVDHSTKRFVRNFYLNNNSNISEPRQSAQLTAVIKAMIEQSLSASGGVNLLQADETELIGKIFYELFLNSHQHGTRGNIRSEWLKKGVRTVYTYGINLNEKGVEGTLKSEPILSKYLSNFQDRNQKRFIEISIVDSGLGYCGRWMADNKDPNDETQISLQKEYDIFKKCFQFRQTSTSDSSKGYGLPIVMDRLTKMRGFLKIRSGRLSLYRDFIETPYKSGEQETYDFCDWDNQEIATKKLAKLPKLAGTSITLLIPLEAKDE